MIGRTYLERGRPVVVQARWGAVAWRCPPMPICFLEGERKGAPRNVLIERTDGSRVVRPFRGLRKPAAASALNIAGAA